MAKLIKLSNISWKQPFINRKKELHLWGSQPEVADFCKFKDSTKRLLNIRFEEKFGIDITEKFQITSDRQISFPKNLRDRIEKIIFENPDSYFTVTVLDTSGDLFAPLDIRWLKNVKRNQGKEWGI
jgi:putative restriction endonuclease